tara:strand:+ start:775 stop:1725 length:951 start_codon:yes stop_codon:yes gene_type:complete
LKKVGFFGRDKWGVEVLNEINRSKNLEIVFVVTNSYGDKLIENYCKQKKLKVFFPQNVNQSSFIRKLKKFNADIFISMSYQQIFKKRILNVPPKGIVNCHAGDLPNYRGRNVLNWVLINNEKFFAITIHQVDENIDTGKIILKKKVRINQKDNYLDLIKKTENLCPKLYIKAINDYINGNIKLKDQSKFSKKSTYFRKRIEGDEYINWNWKSEEIYNFTRALVKPGPFARTKFKNRIYGINFVKPIKNSSNYNPGTIIKNSNGLTIKTGDNAVKITKLINIKNKKEFEIKNKKYFKIGDILLSNLKLKTPNQNAYK